jgi:hypothetical protein
MKDRLTYILFIICIQFFLEFLVNKIVPSFTDGCNQILIANLILFIAVNFIASPREAFIFKRQIILLLSLIFACAFMLITLSAMRGISPGLYLVNYRQDIIGILVLFFMLTAGPLKGNSIRSFTRFSVIMLLIQSSLAMIQYFGPDFLYKFFYEKNSFMRDGQMVNLNEGYEWALSKGRLAVGTFSRFNHLGNVCVFLVVYYAGEKYLNQRVNISVKDVIIISLGVIAILLTGNRLSLLTLLLGFFLVLYKRNRRTALLTLLTGAIALSIYGIYLINLGMESGGQTELSNPLERMMGIFVLLENPFDAATASLSTFGYSLILLPYIISAPVWGAGLYWSGGYPLMSPETSNMTDAYMAVKFAEYGVAGVVIYLAIFFYILRIIKKGSVIYYNIFSILFTILLIQSITDLGIFLRISSFLFFGTAGLYLNNIKYEKSQQSYMARGSYKSL